jgi:hypothetical protein
MENSLSSADTVSEIRVGDYQLLDQGVIITPSYSDTIYMKVKNVEIEFVFKDTSWFCSFFKSKQEVIIEPIFADINQSKEKGVRIIFKDVVNLGSVEVYNGKIIPLLQSGNGDQILLNYIISSLGTQHRNF